MLSLRRPRQGIFIISVLFVTVLVAMFIAAALDLGPWSLRRSGNQSELSAAQRAARSGVEYALARLKSDYNWPGNGGTTTVVDTPSLVVVEDNGNVFGLIRDENQVSQFRIRFNYQDDGSGDADGRPDPASYASSGQYLSVNNLVASTDFAVPLANGPGASVPASPTIHTTIPGHSLLISVEGRCGKYLQAADASNPDPSPGLASYTSTRAEGLYKVTNLGQPVTPAVAATAQNFTTTLPTGSNSVELDSADKAEVGRIRSKGGLTINDGASNNLTAKKTGEFRVAGAVNANPSGAVSSATEVGSEDLYNIPWSEVNQATPTSAPVNNILPAGTYVYWDDGTLHYYDMSPSDYTTWIANPVNQADAGTVMTTANLPATVKTTSSGTGAGLQAKLQILDNTAIQATANTADFAVIPRKGAAGGPGAPAGQVSISLPQLTTGLITSSGLVGGTYPNMTFTAPLSQLLYQASGGQSSWTVGGNVFNNLGSPTGHGAILDLPSLPTALTAVVNYAQANPGDPNVATVIGAFGGTVSAAVDEVAGVPSSAANPKNITVEFKPNGTSAVLSGPGEVRIGALLKGTGASITAEGDINLVGLGVNLSATSNPTEGVSLYSKKDIFISTYDKAADKYADVALKGVVYCWGDFRASLGHSSITDFSKWGKLKLTGAMIAYGKDPDDPNPPTKGNVDVTAEDVSLKFDSAYLLDILSQTSLPPAGQLQYGRMWWTQQ